jgi:hypothetical protein
MYRMTVLGVKSRLSATAWSRIPLSLARTAIAFFLSCKQPCRKRSAKQAGVLAAGTSAVILESGSSATKTRFIHEAVFGSSEAILPCSFKILFTVLGAILTPA